MDLYKEIKRAVEHLKKAGEYRDNRYYFYRLPSPNKGKMLEIIGPVGPMWAAQAADDVWSGKKKPEEIEYMKEVDIRDLMIFTEDRKDAGADKAGMEEVCDAWNASDQDHDDSGVL